MTLDATTHQVAVQARHAQTIIHAVGIEYAVSADALKKKGRTATIAEARNVAMYLIRQITRASYPDTAAFLGRPNHKSAQVAWKAVDTKKHRDPHFKARLARLTQLTALQALANTTDGGCDEREAAMTVGPIINDAANRLGDALAFIDAKRAERRDRTKGTQ